MNTQQFVGQELITEHNDHLNNWSEVLTDDYLGVTETQDINCDRDDYTIRHAILGFIESQD